MNGSVAIVYNSNTGFTKKYAYMLGNRLKLKAYGLTESKALPADTPVIYMGWLRATGITGFSKAKRRFNVLAAVGVGLGDAASQTEAVRKTTKLPQNIPLFVLRGGINTAKLKGVNKLLIGMLLKGLSAKQDILEGEKCMLEALKNGGDFVSEEQLDALVNWYNQYAKQN